MADLNEQENELKVLIKRIDSEIVRFRKILEQLESKRDSVKSVIHRSGLEPVPVNISAGYRDDLIGDIERHVLDLNKTKNFINARLEKVIHEEELLDELKTRFGDGISVKKAGDGFEVQFSDKGAKDAASDFEKSKETLQEIRTQVQKLGQ